MSNDQKTNEFIRDCVIRGARFSNAGHHEAAATLLYSAQRAIMSPQETAPLHHYAGDVAGALRDVFGWDWDLADKSHHVQIEAVAVWGWYAKTFDADLGSSLRAAIDVMKTGGPGWRHQIFKIFANEPQRLDFQRQAAELEKFALEEWA